MNRASQWRLSLARQLAPAYTTYPHVQAVILGGSAARGYADAYSDLELGVFWSQPPTDHQRQRAAEHLGAIQITLDTYDPKHQWWIEDYYLHGVNIDIVHRTTATTDRLLNDVIEQSDTTAYKHVLITALRDSIPLVGETLVTQWQRRTVPYPEALCQAVVHEALTLKPWWSVEVAAKRGSLVLVHHALCLASERLLAALLAINRHYHPGSKWLPYLIADLGIAPEAFANRLQGCFVGALSERVEQMADLIEEVYTLAEQAVPSLDISTLRATFRQRRAPIEPPATFEAG